MSKNVAMMLGVLGSFAFAGVAFAQATTPTEVTAPTASQPQVLNVSAAGKVLLRGTVSAVSTGSVTVKSWGGDWTVNVPTAAEVLPQGSTVSGFQAGDFVGVQGTIDQGAGWTVTATLIRDWTARQALNQEIKTNVKAVRQTVAAGPKTIQGVLSNLDAAAQTFTLTNASGTAYSVSLSSGAKTLAKNWASLDFTKVNDGDTVRVYGTVTGSAVAAEIFRDVSVK